MYRRQIQHCIHVVVEACVSGASLWTPKNSENHDAAPFQGGNVDFGGENFY